MAKLFSSIITLKSGKKSLLVGGCLSEEDCIKMSSKSLIDLMRKQKVVKSKFEVTSCEEIVTEEGLDYSDSMPEFEITIEITKDKI